MAKLKYILRAYLINGANVKDSKNGIGQCSFTRNYQRCRPRGKSVTTAVEEYCNNMWSRSSLRFRNLSRSNDDYFPCLFHYI